MDAMLRVRAAFDPSGLCNPGKIIPTPRGCGEARAVATQSITAGEETSPLPVGEGQGEGFARSNFVPHSGPLPQGDGEARPVWERTTNSKTLVATKLNEARISRELARIVGEQNTRRVS